MADIRTQLGSRIKDLRKRQGWSQDDLAARASLHPTYIGGIERGQRNVSLLNLARIAEALRLSMTELFDFPVQDAHGDAGIKPLISGDDPLGVMFFFTCCKHCPYLKSYRVIRSFLAASPPSPPTPRKPE